MQDIAIFSGRFNPPGLGHQLQAIELGKYFDKIIVVPCGPRPDKPLTMDIPSYYRAALVDLAFSQIPKTEVDLFDLEANTFTKTHQLQQKYHELGNIWHVVSAAMIQNGAQGISQIQQEWENGNELWNKLNFAILYNPEKPVDSQDLPPNYRLIAAPQLDSTAQLRQSIYNHEDLTGQIDKNVLDYINRFQLYQGMMPRFRCLRKVSYKNPLLVVDYRNSRAKELAEQFNSCQSGPPDIIIAIGGDGTMLKAIRQHWRKRLPFYGINTGHLGFLLNEQAILPEETNELISQFLPLLHVDIEGPKGNISGLAFNDAWVERNSGQTAHLEISVDNQIRLPKLVADGALISTAAGSTSYARAMGAMPLPLESQAQLLVGSNVLDPAFFRPVVLPISSTITIKTLDPINRPLSGFIDGHSYGQVTSLTTRPSRVASIELLFAPNCDFTEKLARIQFPK